MLVCVYKTQRASSSDRQVEAKSEDHNTCRSRKCDMTLFKSLLPLVPLLSLYVDGSVHPLRLLYYV